MKEKMRGQATVWVTLKTTTSRERQRTGPRPPSLHCQKQPNAQMEGGPRPSGGTQGREGTLGDGHGHHLDRGDSSDSKRQLNHLKMGMWKRWATPGPERGIPRRCSARLGRLPLWLRHLNLPTCAMTEAGAHAPGRACPTHPRGSGTGKATPESPQRPLPTHRLSLCPLVSGHMGETLTQKGMRTLLPRAGGWVSALLSSLWALRGGARRGSR